MFGTAPNWSVVDAKTVLFNGKKSFNGISLSIFNTTTTYEQFPRRCALRE
ncbi:hypothetical protein [Priestia taiwanensis]|uniref:Uncharacterized protein n=1 Tax=Priestia taiwanensis TaxID=1347902 RepID=A0A917ESH4_9BACI|nr:hypothetical protein [Priestia taiwanensis]MBM7364466.1 hypothetical protein [Priestia taiwanensis]GGE81231.1 hypothetical protein GCM10007140_33520 [Priestia taiwanensis]